MSPIRQRADPATWSLGDNGNCWLSDRQTRSSVVFLRKNAFVHVSVFGPDAPDAVRKAAAAIDTDIREGTGGVELGEQVGDKIYTKHFLVDNVVSEGIHWADISLLYCTIREGKINMVNGWNLLEPIHVDNKKDGIYTANYSSDDRNWAVVKHPSEFLLSTGIKEGDTVAFRDGCDYKFEFEGETLIRTRTVDIFGKLQEPIHGDI